MRDLRKGRAMALAIGVAALILIGCGAVNRTVERKVHDALPTYIGPARTWEVHIDSPPDRTLRGRVRHLTIDGSDVQLPRALAAKSLHLDLRDVDVDTRSQTLRSIRAASFSAEFDEDAVNSWLQAHPSQPDAAVHVNHIDLQGDRLMLEATLRALGRDWPFTVTAAPRLASPTHADLDPDRVAVIGLTVPLPPSVLRWLAARLSDGLDLTGLPFPVALDSLEVRDSHVVISGTADVVDSLNRLIARQ